MDRTNWLVGIAAILSTIWLAPATHSAEGLAFPEKSVVLIRSVKQAIDQRTPWKTQAMRQTAGSGVIISGSRVLTNAHNVSDCRYLELRKENLAKRYRARVLFVGHDCDLAVLAVDDSTFFEGMLPLELAGIPKVNSTVSTYGFPIGGGRISVTEGVVSRIEMDTYAHSASGAHLVIQTDAAINPGNSGGPVIQDGKVVGIAFQGLREAENIGYLIPTTVIDHFLEDIEDGRYDGFGSLGLFLFTGLHNRNLGDYLAVPANEDGVVVTGTMMHSSLESVLQRNDVLTQMAEYDIDNDAMVTIHGLRLYLSAAVDSQQIGDTVPLTFYRQGKKMTATATIALNRPVLERAHQYDEPPRYVCFAGLVFVPATRDFLQTWGRDWPEKIPFYLRYLYAHSEELNEDRQRKEYVVLSEIMPDKVNSYAGEFSNLVVDTINGQKIHRLEDIRDAFAGTSEGYLQISFMGQNQPLLIDAEMAHAKQTSILQRYNIPAEARLEEEL
jgi:S1-C subfamily serine protease